MSYIKRISTNILIAIFLLVTTANAQSNSDNKTYASVDQPAEFPGGQAKLMSWLAQNIRYPDSAQQNGIEGIVTVRFVVEKDGSVSGVTVLKGVEKDLDAEAIRVVKRMPKWQGGKHNGQAVRSYFTLPITFKLVRQTDENKENDQKQEYNRIKTWEELNRNMLSWEEYYKKNKIRNLPNPDKESIEKYIKNNIEKWQEKDEFETTEQWKSRVNEATRQEKIKELSSEVMVLIQNEQNRLSREYENYKQNLLNNFYRDRIEAAKREFSINHMELKPYDADNGTFLITSEKYGDILLPVPLKEARSFKENWETIKRNIKPEFVPNGEDVALTKLIFTNNGKQYVYDGHTEANYAVTDVKYNFKPVELADISLADINTNLPALANADVSGQIISKTSNDVITPQKVQTSKNTVLASDRSNVDYAIPTGYIDDKSNTFAVIIANEDYSSNARVPYAANDGEIMAKYLTTAVGLPENHVKVYRNATYGKIAEAMNYIEKLGEAYGDKMNLILYYAGHGAPDEKSKTAMLLPVDGNPSISKTCYSVDELVKNLGSLKANNVIVVLDACFSGATRNDDMLVAASGKRGVRLRSNEISPIGNMVVLSATQGDETAYPYDREQHGLFTYFLLKKLQENKGNVTLGELADYVIENVRQTSIVNNGKLQTPTVTVSPNLLGSWREIQLK